ncbi:hypothetical protein IFM89_032797, partial [Coptis chinensis]
RNPEEVRVRFALSPTGNLHVGGALELLFSITHSPEDTYLERSTKESKNVVLQHLSWLGLDWDWDEGLGISGDYGPYQQSGRNYLYNHYAKKLLDSGHVYRCFCSNEVLHFSIYFYFYPALSPNLPALPTPQTNSSSNVWFSRS